MISRRSLLTGLAAAFAAPVVARFAPPPGGWIREYWNDHVIETPVSVAPPPDRLTMQHIMRAAQIARENKIPPIIYDGQPHYLLVWSDEEKRYVFRANV